MFGAHTKAADLDSRDAAEAGPRKVHDAKVVQPTDTAPCPGEDLARHIQHKIETKIRENWEKGWNKKWAKKFGDNRPVLTLGNIVQFVLGVLLWPLFLCLGALSSLGHAVALVRSTVEALISTGFWCVLLLKEGMARMFLHRDDPRMLKLKGGRRAFWHEAAKDWTNAGKALVGIGRKFSGTFGLGGLFASFEQRIQRASEDWRRYVVNSSPTGAAPGDFPEGYVIVDQLPPGGSSARLYVVRKKDEHGNVDASGPLFVLKYFDLTQGGNLESIVRESQAAELAKKLGLIIESNLGTRAFWYIMPYYQGRTLTRATLDGVKESRRQGPRAFSEQQRLALGWIHQVLQIIAQYHESGVFHKDIKPDNLIVNGERIYLIDIGLMTPLASMHQLTTHGTEYFRDPEMVKLALEGREVRQVNASKFDIYSIGAVLYFAIEGEFPTSGPLSRFSPDVPLAVQWVSNRAMAGMNQRYETARQMLTDVDYLCWAAAQGMLDGIKPADLPSFRGVPVPHHLMPAMPQTGYAAGGYGAWYTAPTFRPQVRNRGWRWAIAGGLIVGGVLVLGGAAKYISIRHDGGSQPDQSLASHLPAGHGNDVEDAYDRIEQEISRRHISVETTTHLTPLARTELVPRILQMARERTGDKPGGLRLGIGQAPPRPAPPAEIVFLPLDVEAADAALVQGIEREFTLEVARTLPGSLATMVEKDRIELARMVTETRDLTALHLELAARCAQRGKVPPLFVFFELVPSDGGARRLELRMLSPGREWRDTLTFNNGDALVADSSVPGLSPLPGRIVEPSLTAAQHPRPG